MIIKIRQKGDFSKTYRFLSGAKDPTKNINFEEYGEKGIIALRSATPKNTGLTSESWRYEINKEKGKVTLRFCNDNIQSGMPIAIILQYGHATKNGGWVEGIDYINPAIKPIFDSLTEDMWKEVVKSI